MTSVPASSVTTTATDSGHAATYIGSITRTYRFQPDIVLRPAAQAPASSDDWPRAFHACFAPAGCVATGDATVSIASVTGPSGFPSASGNLFNSAPVFVVVWQPSTMCVTVDAPSCRLIDLIPLSTYKVTYAFQVAATAPTPSKA